MWSYEKMDLVRTMPESGNECKLYAVQYGKGGAPLIATAGAAKNEVRIFGRNSNLVKSRDFKVIPQLVASYTDTSAFYTLDMTANSALLCAGGASKTLFLFDVDTTTALL